MITIEQKKRQRREIQNIKYKKVIPKYLNIYN